MAMAHWPGWDGVYVAIRLEGTRMEDAEQGEISGVRRKRHFLFFTATLEPLVEDISGIRWEHTALMSEEAAQESYTNRNILDFV